MYVTRIQKNIALLQYGRPYTKMTHFCHRYTVLDICTPYASRLINKNNHCNYIITTCLSEAMILVDKP
jgi:hypothetical protein